MAGMCLFCYLNLAGMARCSLQRFREHLPVSVCDCKTERRVNGESRGAFKQPQQSCAASRDIFVVLWTVPASYAVPRVKAVENALAVNESAKVQAPVPQQLSRCLGPHSAA